jgi:hypothetical protein
VNTIASSGASSAVPRPRGPLTWIGVLLAISGSSIEQTCSLEKEKLMASPTTFRSPYALRLELVRDTITSHTKLGGKEAGELAEHVLDALNSIPEKIR